MATKAAKSITINATKYELANALGVANGKLQLKAKDVVLSEAELPVGDEALFFRHVYDEDSETWSIEVTNAKGETITNKAEAFEILEKGGTVYAVYPGGGGDVYQTMTNSFGDATGFHMDFERPMSDGANTVTIIRVDWFGDTPTWTEKGYDGHFVISKTGLTSLSGLAVGDAVTYSGVDFPLQQPLNNLGLTIKLTHNLQCKCISSMVQEYGIGTSGITFIACYNSEQYLIGIKNQNGVYTIGSLKAL